MIANSNITVDKNNKNFKQTNKDYNELISLGIRNVQRNNFENAVKNFLNAININSKKYQAFINLSNVYILQNKIKEGVEILKKYLVENNYKINVINHLGIICLKYNYENDLKDLFKYLDQDLNSLNNKSKFFLYYLRGKYLQKKDNINYAIDSYKKSIDLNNNYLETYIDLLSLLEQINNLEEFKIYLDVANINFIHDYRIKFFESLYYNRVKEIEQSQKIISRYTLQEKLKNNQNIYPRILDLMSKNYEKKGNYNLSFKKIQERNIFLSKLPENKKFNKNIILDTIQTYRKFFVKENFKKILNLPKHNNLVFLIGFPRSGTTLLDSILRTHSKTLVLEEKPYLLNVRHNYFKNNNNKIDSIKSLSFEKIAELQKNYFEQINLHNKNKEKIIIDKFPLSIVELGFIKIIFPEAKIILAMRHPCDAVISCYFSFFKMNDAMINFLDLKDSVSFYNSVFNLFEQFEREINLGYHIIKYEDLVKNFKETLEKLLKYINLDYEKKLEDFYSTAKKRDKIHTPSYSQVIQPIYNTSINRYINFEDAKFIEPLLEKWINRFGYS